MKPEEADPLGIRDQNHEKVMEKRTTSRRNLTPSEIKHFKRRQEQKKQNTLKRKKKKSYSRSKTITEDFEIL